MTHEGQFKPGQSGNPNGRPKGTRNRYTRYRKQIEAHVPDIIEKLVKMAMDGDIAAARVLLDRVWPAGAEEELELRDRIEELEHRLEMRAA
ncbi:MAG: DUF5681 domain-containing protein [Akkermansiaceae bacterium]